WLRVTLASAHVVCSQGPFWTSFFNRYAEASGKIAEMRNGIVLPRSPEPREGEGNRFIFVGAMDRNKGIFELLSAFCRVHAEHPGATLTMVGGGRDFDALRAAAREAGVEGSISMRGWVPHERIAELLREHDAFVFPSHWEGLPNALLEAMATG